MERKQIHTGVLVGKDKGLRLLGRPRREMD
jgi:hypothetical protein